MAEPEFRWTQDDWNQSQNARWSAIRMFQSNYGWLVRGVIVILGLLVFELTANAAVSTAVGCLEFARSDFQTARWLRKTDPDRKRGRICARCYTAWAFFRVCLISLVIMSIVVHLAAFGRGPQGQLPIEVVLHIKGALGLMGFALVISVWQSFRVILATLWNRQRIWLGPEPRWARQQGVWPPSAATPSRSTSNQAKAIFYLGISFLVAPTMFVLAYTLKHFAFTPWISLALFALIVLEIGIIMPMLEGRVLASSPSECWPLDDSSPALTL